MNNKLAFLIYACIGVITFFGTWHNPYMLDDHLVFDAQSTDSRYFLDHLLPNEHKTLKTNEDYYYRPLMRLIFFASHACFGENPALYHLLNLALMCAAVFFIYVLVSMVFKDKWLAFLTGLFYLVHPINGILVNYKTASYLIFQTMVMLFGLMSYYKFEISRNRSLLLLSVGLFCVSVLLHETAIVFPLYVFALHWVMTRSQPKGKSQMMGMLVNLIPFVIVLGFYLIVRWHCAEVGALLDIKFKQMDMNLVSYAATLSSLIGWYLEKLIFPSGIVMIWVAPVVRENIVLALVKGLVLVMAAGGLIYCMRKSAAALLGLMWLMIGFLPFFLGALFQTQGLMIEPHWFAFSSIGFFLFFASLVRNITLPVSIDDCSSKPINDQRTIVEILTATYVFDKEKVSNNTKQYLQWTAVILTALMWLTLSSIHNAFWSNEKSYCQFWLQNVPNFKTPKFYLARAYLQEGDYGHAKKYYTEAISGQSSDSLIFSNLGLISLAQQQLNEAERFLLKAISIDPEMSLALNTLGVVYLKQGDLEKSKQCFNRSIAMDPQGTAARINLMKLLAKEGDKAGFMEQQKKLLAIHPSFNQPSGRGTMFIK